MIGSWEVVVEIALAVEDELRGGIAFPPGV